MRLNRSKVYDLSELTSEERNELYEHLCNLQEELKLISVDEYDILEYETYNEWCYWYKENSIKYKYTTHNAKELFYTLENVQVDCRELTDEQIKEMADIFENNGYIKWDDETALLKEAGDVFRVGMGSEFYMNYKADNKTTITYDKFMELFGNKEEDKQLQPHYDNTNGSIYKFCNDQKLNAWEFDIIKRVVRCRKKGLFKEDLQKTKDLINVKIRPKSLQGIENNNMWIKIESEDDLPKEEKDYWVVDSDGEVFICFFDTDYKAFAGYFHYDQKGEITHYQPIQKPLKPLY